jgi:polygalacturonase
MQGDRKNVTNWVDSSCNEWKQCRPRLLGVINSSQITLSNLRILDSVFWTTHILNSSHVTVTDVYIRGDYNIPNNDGIDVDSSVDVIVRNVDIDTADDCICIKAHYPNMPTENVLVSGGILASRSAAIKFGSESRGDFRNITIENIEVRQHYSLSPL